MKIQMSRKWLRITNIQNSPVLFRLQEASSSLIKMKRIMISVLVIKEICLNRIRTISSLKQLNDIIVTNMIQKVHEKKSYLRENADAS